MVYALVRRKRGTSSSMRSCSEKGAILGLSNDDQPFLPLCGLPQASGFVVDGVDKFSFQNVIVQEQQRGRNET
jgi:hypothetical protein